jgi:hypothetical protein
MQIRPHYPCVHTRSCAHQMVVVVPVRADCLKTPNINKKYRKQGYKRGERSISRHPYTENGDSDNDGHHSIAECFESCRIHYVYYSIVGCNEVVPLADVALPCIDSRTSSTRQPARLTSTQVEVRDSSVQASDQSDNGDSETPFSVSEFTVYGTGASKKTSKA